MPKPLGSLRKSLYRFRRDRRGVTAVEFALVAPIFFVLLFAIIETAMVFFTSQILETIAQDSARLVLTGQAQSGSLSQDDFHKAVCAHKLSFVFDCNAIGVDVRSYPQATVVKIPNQIGPGSTFINDMKYCPGRDGDIVVVRLFYQWPVIVIKMLNVGYDLQYDLSNLSGSKRLLSAVAVFKNEPFLVNGMTCS
ncbi:pilus assembly protein [Bradyrhizobium sp. BRP22]|uniref:TadE/TadG family type IV pilus assembly protein n=1 Tax=Bradyrhizobium sp. BRP22 TaxID=2793821 RepID=UPI001CD7F6CA|nr:TadE/TadG family type IV pilus assembly protein [Bradyrhizobium sp. BRP22]MCA1451911.1 pilus assembly protein [Bradyrhizobium sp. BRP22]